MNLNKYVDDNLDEIIDTLNEKEQNFEEDHINETIENAKNDTLNEKQIVYDDYYYSNLINIHMKYYNKIHKTNKHLYEDLTNEFKMNAQMDLLTQSIFKFNNYKEEIGIIDNQECLNYIVPYNEFIKCCSIDDIYTLTTNSETLYSQSLIIIFNYIIVKNIDEWDITKLN